MGLPPCAASKTTHDHPKEIADERERERKREREREKEIKKDRERGEEREKDTAGRHSALGTSVATQ